MVLEKKCACQVISASSGLNALELLGDYTPDVVISDIKMPDLDGFGVLSLLRSEGNPVPVVMCSGSALQNDIDRAYAGGCSGYLEKPTTLEDYRAMAGAIPPWRFRGGAPGIGSSSPWAMRPRHAKNAKAAAPAVCWNSALRGRG